MNTEDNKQLFLVIFDLNMGNIAATCRLVDISRACYYLWVKGDPGFAMAVNAVKEGNIDFTESQLLSCIRDRDLSAIKYYLSTQAKHRGYVYREEHAGPGGGPIPIDMDITNYPPEPKTVAEWEEQIEEARKKRKDKKADEEALAEIINTAK